MLKPKTLTITGFRGFAGEQMVKLDSPLTLLYGENHHGKSSTLNGLEWCLYGGDCTGKQTGIRERVDWEIPNRHLTSPNVIVELTLENRDGRHILRRSLEQRTKRSALKEELLLVLPDGTRLTGEEAGSKLVQLRPPTFRDFLTTVYQHQEAIRAILTQEPRERNDAIDRLLGLSDYRNLLASIDAAKLPAAQKALGQRLDSFVARIETALQTRENDLRDKRLAASEGGLTRADLTAKGALKLAGDVAGALRAFAEEAKLPLPACEVPAEWKCLKAFRTAVKNQCIRLRGALPEAVHQVTWLGKRADLLEHKTQYERSMQALDAAHKAANEFTSEHGDEATMHARLQDVLKSKADLDDRLRRVNDRATLLREGIALLEKVATNGIADRCPLCDSKADNLLDRLRREWEENVKIEAQEINEALTTLRAEKATLDELAGKRKDLAGKVVAADAELMLTRARVGEFLGKDLGAVGGTLVDDPLVLLLKNIKKVQDALDELSAAIQCKQEKLAAVEAALERVGLVLDILELEEKKDIVAKIRESTEYRELEGLRDQVAGLVEDVQQIKVATSGAATAEAKKKLAAAEKVIDTYFRRIANNPAIARLKLAVEPDARTGRNAYEFTGQDGRDLRPILSQGDLNALALAIFLGLACTAGDADSFGFLMLDDPSQSLGSAHKAQLVEVLNDVLEKKAVIVSTMDAELQRLLSEGISKVRTTYLFSGWTPEHGPLIELA